jgi:hypothetical protein
MQQSNVAITNEDYGKILEEQIARIRRESHQNDLRSVPSLINQLVSCHNTLIEAANTEQNDATNSDNNGAEDDDQNEIPLVDRHDVPSDSQDEIPDQYIDIPRMSLHRFAAHYLAAWAIHIRKKRNWGSAAGIVEEDLMIHTIPHMVNGVGMNHMVFRIAGRPPNKRSLVIYGAKPCADIIDATAEFYNMIIEFVQAYANWLIEDPGRPIAFFGYFGKTDEEIERLEWERQFSWDFEMDGLLGKGSA